jgi:hypothetical protein
LNSETLQLIYQAYGDDAMRRAAVFKWWKRFRDRETKAKVNLVAGKVMLILFFDAKGIIVQHRVTPGQTASGQCYVTVLRRDFRNVIKKKSPNFFRGKMVPPSRQC